MIDCMIVNAVSSVISVELQQQVHLHMLIWSCLTITLQNILSSPLAAYPHNHRRNN